MAKDCGPSAALDKLNDTIASAKGTADGLIADATNGIATQVSGLASQISGLTDGIKADLDVAAPELPKPAFTLQSQMTNLLSNADNPGALVQQMDEIREKFGDKVDVDAMFDEFGLDSKELGNLNTDYKSKLSEANKIKELQDKGANLTDAPSLDLIGLATGDVSSIGKIIGGAVDKIFSKGKSQSELLDKVCTNIPNLEMDAEGNVIEKGPETKIPEADAEIDDETADVKAELEPEVIDTSLQQIDDLIGDAADTPPDETETEPFDFAKPIDPDEIILDGFQEDQDKLAELQSKLREERAKKFTRKQKEKKRQELYYQTALSRTIVFVAANIDIKYNLLAKDNPKLFEGTEFEVRNETYSKHRPKRRPDEIVISKHQADKIYRNAPKGSDSGRLKELENQVKNLEYVTIAEGSIVN